MPASAALMQNIRKLRLNELLRYTGVRLVFGASGIDGGLISQLSEPGEVAGDGLSARRGEPKPGAWPAPDGALLDFEVSGVLQCPGVL